MTYNIDDYVDVAERIREFYERFPDGRLCAGSQPRVVEIDGKPFVWYHARAYRTPDDPVPGDGFAAEPVPGPTQFTRDSELMNAETAAWGRAIVALGFATKKIASAQEVRNRSGNAESVQRSSEPRPAGNGSGDTAKPTEAQLKFIRRLMTDRGIDNIGKNPDALSKAEASRLIEQLKDGSFVPPEQTLEAALAGGDPLDSDIPFEPTI